MVVVPKTGGRKCYHFPRAWVIARSRNKAQKQYKRWEDEQAKALQSSNE